MSQKPIVILDANAFITCSGLLDIGANHRLITTSSVMQQLRDVKTRDMLQKFVFVIQEQQPTKKSIQVVKQFAKKTGDITSLSDVDIQLLALTHSIYVNKGFQNKLRNTPPQLKEWVDKQGSQNQQQDIKQGSQYSDYSDDKSDDKQYQREANEQQQTKNQPKQTQKAEQNKQTQNNLSNKNDQQAEDDGWIVVPQQKKKKAQQSDEDLGQDEGWITPQNFERKMAEGTAIFQNEDEQQQQKQQSTGISLMTADFAMQNVAIQMGIYLKSLDGRQIKEVRRFILQCYVCWKQYKIDSNQVKLCKQCGYNSLSKIAYSLNPKGQMILHRKKGWKPNKKVEQWKQRKLEQQQKKKKHQHARRKKQASIFDV